MLDEQPKKVAVKTRSITRHYGALVQADVKARARQLFDVTDYDRSITLQSRGRRWYSAAVIQSRAPQAHRLEYGFTGVDSQGRTVSAPPYPHFRPALRKYANPFRRAIESVLR